MNWRSQGKSALAKMLMQEHGVSKRQAEKAVNAVFSCMARALQRGEVVELPVGTIEAVALPAGRKTQTVQKFENIQNGKTFSRLVRARRRIIRFKPNPRLIEKAPFPPPPPGPEELRKAEECEQLISALGFPNIGLPDWRALLAAAGGNLDWLLARLRQLRRDGHKFKNLDELAATVKDLYWIRK